MQYVHEPYLGSNARRLVGTAVVGCVFAAGYWLGYGRGAELQTLRDTKLPIASMDRYKPRQPRSAVKHVAASKAPAPSQHVTASAANSVG